MNEDKVIATDVDFQIRQRLDNKIIYNLPLLVVDYYESFNRWLHPVRGSDLKANLLLAGRL